MAACHCITTILGSAAKVARYHCGRPLNILNEVGLLPLREGTATRRVVVVAGQPSSEPTAYSELVGRPSRERSLHASERDTPQSIPVGPSPPRPARAESAAAPTLRRRLSTFVFRAPFFWPDGPLAAPCDWVSFGLLGQDAAREPGPPSSHLDK